MGRAPYISLRKAWGSRNKQLCVQQPRGCVVVFTSFKHRRELSFVQPPQRSLEKKKMSNKVFDFWGCRYKIAQRIDGQLPLWLTEFPTKRIWTITYWHINRGQIHECFLDAQPQWKKKEEKMLTTKFLPSKF